MDCETTSSLLREQHARARHPPATSPLSSWPLALPSSPKQPSSPAASPSPLLSPLLRAPSGACTAPSPPSWPSPPLSWPPPGRPAQLLRPRAAFDWLPRPPQLPCWRTHPAVERRTHRKVRRDSGLASAVGRMSPPLGIRRSERRVG
jgi:hypothetical protein